MEAKPHQSSPNPPSSLSSSLFRDISNFKTPKHQPRNPNFHSPCPQFFTASKETPRSSSTIRRHRPSLAPSNSAARSKVARRLKAFELEQSKSARKAQIDKERSLRSLAKSLTVWLNFLFENPTSCGCDLSKMMGEDGQVESTEKRGKREGLRGGGVRVDATWRCPKRQKDLSWRGSAKEDSTALSNSVLLSLQNSLRDVCSFDDLKQRMNYLNLGSCEEIFSVLAQVTKTIDEGRLQMKAHCPIETDVGLKEKALRILMCYNPTWLQIGLYIIFGGDSLLPEGDVNSEQDICFLRMVIERQFFSHAGLARIHAYNKLVEGLYRPGYYEALGSIILKRFLLLVLILDRAKTQSCLPIQYGIDGLDGGSPLLFTSQSNIKSSSQVLHDFLSSDVMHGEGNVLAHLVIVGYKVSYQQSALNEYDFRVMELFEDLCDGVRLCRAVQLLQHDTSVLMKMVVPSDSRKRNLVNCGIALQHLKQAGVPLSDEDGLLIIEEDIVSGDKELTLSLLWNIFVHLQMPLLINRSLLFKEISRIRGVNIEYSNSSALDMLLKWIQAICETYGFKIDEFVSLVDGKAMWCLLDYYFRKELKCSCSPKDMKETSIMSVGDYTDAVHNFILSQKLTTLLGNFPEVMEVSEVLEHKGACNSQSVVILLVFLSFQLVVRKNTDQLNFHKILGYSCQSPVRKYAGKCFEHSGGILNQGSRHRNDNEVHAAGTRDFKAIMAWWQDMALRNKRFHPHPVPISQCLSSGRVSYITQRENGATIIQSYFRKFVERKSYLRKKNAVVLLQTVVRAWLVKKNPEMIKLGTSSQEPPLETQELEVLSRYARFIVDRYNFIKLKRSVALIQRAVRVWIYQRHHVKSLIQDIFAHEVDAAIVVQKYFRGWKGRSVYHQIIAQSRKSSFACEKNKANGFHINAISTIQLAWRKFVLRKALHRQHFAATKIQCCYRGWFIRKIFLSQKQATILIQRVFRGLRCSRDFRKYMVATRSVIVIQSHMRGWIARRGTHRMICLIVRIQSYYRGYLMRREFLVQKEAAMKIQSVVRSTQYCKVFHCYKQAATEIQKFVRGQLTRRRLLGVSCLHRVVPTGDILISGVSFHSPHFNIFLCSILKLQRWWRDVLMQRSGTKAAIVIQSHIRGSIARRAVTAERYRITSIQRWWRGVLMQKSRIKSAVKIQSNIRGWIARREAARGRHRITVIQSYWKGYLARKGSRDQLLDLRLRVQKSAANVDDGMRLINRLVAALSDLLSMKSVTGILHTCATLDMATQHSQICCEKLAEAGAVDTLLKLIQSVSRSIPDQEVLKHALSTLRNLGCYSHLTEVLIASRSSVDTLLWEFVRNKEEGYFITSELLKKICANPKGIEAVRKSPALLKRVHNLVEDLSRKAGNEKRNIRGLHAREQVERRLREAVELLNLITSG